VTDDTPPSPRLSYGAQKLIGEILIADYTRRGYLDGCSLRLPTVMVRPGTRTPRSRLGERDHSRAARRPRLHLPGAARHAHGVHFSAARGGRVPAVQHPLPEHFSSRHQCERAADVGRGEGSATGKVSFAPDDRLQQIMDAVPKTTVSKPRFHRQREHRRNPP
jgi:hypothetical protein